MNNGKNDSLYFLDVFKVVYFTFNLFANTGIRRMTTFWNLFSFVRKCSVSLNLVSDLLVMKLCVVIVLLNLNPICDYGSSRPQTVSQYFWECLGVFEKDLTVNANTQLLVYFSCMSFLFPLLNTLLSSHVSSSVHWCPRS